MIPTSIAARGFVAGYAARQLEDAGIASHTGTDLAIADAAGEAERCGDYDTAHRMALEIARGMGMPTGLSKADEGRWWIGYYRGRHAATGGAEVVSVTEIAQRASVQRQTVHQWRRRHPDFPPPLAELAVGPVWAWPDVEAWIARPRPSGRHKG